MKECYASGGEYLRRPFDGGSQLWSTARRSVKAGFRKGRFVEAGIVGATPTAHPLIHTLGPAEPLPLLEGSTLSGSPIVSTWVNPPGPICNNYTEADKITQQCRCGWLREHHSTAAPLPKGVFQGESLIDEDLKKTARDLRRFFLGCALTVGLALLFIGLCLAAVVLAFRAVL